ncbi:MAG TPA: hypothetical protein VFB02_27360 [Bradyrhizobium sp.]|nr:hypothetical protein [Bradyrhizobium sp.]
MALLVGAAIPTCPDTTFGACGRTACAFACKLKAAIGAPPARMTRHVARAMIALASAAVEWRLRINRPPTL